MGLLYLTVFETSIIFVDCEYNNILSVNLRYMNENFHLSVFLSIYLPIQLSIYTHYNFSLWNVFNTKLHVIEIFKISKSKYFEKQCNMHKKVFEEKKRGIKDEFSLFSYFHKIIINQTEKLQNLKNSSKLLLLFYIHVYMYIYIHIYLFIYYITFIIFILCINIY